MDKSPASNQVTLEDALKIANTHLKSGNLYVAEATYNDVLKIYPDNAEAYFGLGLTSYYKGSLHDSVAFYKKSLEINPDSAPCLNTCGIALAALGQHEEAI